MVGASGLSASIRDAISDASGGCSGLSNSIRDAIRRLGAPFDPEEGREIHIRTLAPPLVDEILQSAFRIHPQPNLFVVRSGHKLHGARTIVDYQNLLIL